MNVSDLGKKSASTPAYSLTEEKKAKQQAESTIKVQTEIARMIEKQTLTMPFDKSAFTSKSGSGEAPSETAGRYNTTKA